MTVFARANDAIGIERWRTGTPDGPGWHPLRALLEDGALRDAVVADIERRCSPSGPELGPRYLAAYLGRALTAVPTARYLLDGRAVGLDVDAIRIRTDPLGWFPEVALAEPADAPDLLPELVGLLTPVVDALQRFGGIGRRALWCLMLDGIGLACAATGREDAAGELLARAPLRAHRVVFVDGAWASNGCCRADLAAGGELCALCPKRPDAPRGSPTCAGAAPRTGSPHPRPPARPRSRPGA